MAVVADLYHEALMGVPVRSAANLRKSLVLGTVCAVVLNLIMRIGVRQRVSFKLAPGGINREAVEQFLSEQGARWAARRDIIRRATFRRGPGIEWWVIRLAASRSRQASMNSTSIANPLCRRAAYHSRAQNPRRRRSWRARTASGCLPAICSVKAPTASTHAELAVRRNDAALRPLR